MAAERFGPRGADPVGVRSSRPLLTTDLVRRLRALATAFVAEAATQKSTVLRECAASHIDDPRRLPAAFAELALVI